MKNLPAYQAPLADVRFVAWQQNQLESALALNYPHLTRTSLDQLWEEAACFAENTLSTSYQEADQQGCWLDEFGEVHVPVSYSALLKQFREKWGKRLGLCEQGGQGLPLLAKYLVLEMFMGAHPAFMAYISFNRLALQLLTRYGSQEQQASYSAPLSEYRWTSCLCITEANAGSDLGRMTTLAERQNDGRYLITGEKRFVSAGMHSLTENILYFVVARIKNSPPGVLGLSCFIVPRFDKGATNHIVCLEVIKKMGLKGCANTHLRFGGDKPCYGYLLGDKENSGLVQLMSIMTSARLITGLYAQGMASSAYLNVLNYATHRIQGTRFALTSGANAPYLPIIAHADIRRMLSKMKAQTEGGRALLGKISLAETEYLSALQQGESISAKKQLAFFELLTHLFKAYCSKEVWDVAENAIQIMGGKGYLSAYPIEQYARDCKILSIWEETSHTQAQLLLRDKLGMGLRDTPALHELRTRLRAFIQQAQHYSELTPLTLNLCKVQDAVQESLDEVGNKVRQGEIAGVPACANTIIEMLAELVIGWCLVDAAYSARSLGDDVLYESKLATAQYFILIVLPLTIAKAEQVHYLIQADSVANAIFTWDSADA